MFKQKHLSKLIFAVPILFIILTATVITLIHINQRKTDRPWDLSIMSTYTIHIETKDVFIVRRKKRPWDLNIDHEGRAIR